MKTTIYYFTGTGNSLAVAKKIRDGLGNCELIAIKNEIKKKNINIESSIIGIVFPTYFSSTPPIVLDFINKVNMEKTKYIFAVATAGGMAGYSFSNINKILIAKNRKINLEYKITMPGNYIIPWYYKMANRTSSGKKALYKKSEESINKLVDLINSKKEKKYKMNFIIEKSMSNNLVKYSKENNYKEWDKNFYSDKRCISCGTCEKICPVQNIKLNNGKPVWHQNCQLCMACIQLCPKEAIQYNNETLNRKRYHHPEITVKEIIG